MSLSPPISKSNLRHCSKHHRCDQWVWNEI